MKLLRYCFSSDGMGVEASRFQPVIDTRGLMASACNSSVRKLNEHRARYRCSDSENEDERPSAAEGRRSGCNCQCQVQREAPSGGVPALCLLSSNKCSAVFASSDCYRKFLIFLLRDERAQTYSLSCLKAHPEVRFGLSCG